MIKIKKTAINRDPYDFAAIFFVYGENTKIKHITKFQILIKYLIAIFHVKIQFYFCIVGEQF